jgi:hypothetical protein
MKTTFCLAVTLAAAAGVLAADKPLVPSAAPRLPVKEVTVFKDGHAYLAHDNEVGRITWKLALEPGKPVEVSHAWHYYWR